MRITGGTHRSRKLETPKGDAIRPTSDKVRQAVFNMLNSRGVIEEAIVIDAFCGTGALGLEAISQGAKFCTFFDKSKNSVSLCTANIQNLKEEDITQIMFGDISDIQSKPHNLEAATLVFLDPPYHRDLVPKAIQSLLENNWLSNDVFFVIEIAKDEVLDINLIEQVSEKFYGDTKIILAKLN